MVRPPRTKRSMNRSTLGAGVATIVAIALWGCGKSTTDPGTGGGGSSTTTFVGTMGGPSDGGKVTIVATTGSPTPQMGTTLAQAVVTATGALQPRVGAAVGLSGTYNTTTKELSVSGGSDTFTGTYFSGGLSGTWARTAAPTSGSFVLVFATSSTSVHAYSGTFTSTIGGGSGTFNFAYQGSMIDGIAYTSSGTQTRLQGTLIDGRTIIIIINPANPTQYHANGTLNTTNNTVSGTFDDGAGNTGMWAGIGL